MLGTTVVGFLAVVVPAVVVADNTAAVVTADKCLTAPQISCRAADLTAVVVEMLDSSGVGVVDVVFATTVVDIASPVLPELSFLQCLNLAYFCRNQYSQQFSFLGLIFGKLHHHHQQCFPEGGTILHAS